MKKQLTYEIGEKPSLTNEVEILATIKFLHKAEATAKLYERHAKALKEYMLNQGLNDIILDGYHANIATGTARRTPNNVKLNEFLKAHNTDLENFKELGNPPKSLKIYRD